MNSIVYSISRIVVNAILVLVNFGFFVSLCIITYGFYGDMPDGIKKLTGEIDSKMVLITLVLFVLILCFTFLHIYLSRDFNSFYRWIPLLLPFYYFISLISITFGIIMFFFLGSYFVSLMQTKRTSQ